jgi:hypothetical protein
LEGAENCFAMASSLLHPGGMLERAMLLEKRKAYTEALEESLRLLHWLLARPLVEERKVLPVQQRIQRLRGRLEKSK